MDVNPVYQRPGDFAHVIGNLGGVTPAGLARIREIAAGGRDA